MCSVILRLVARIGRAWTSERCGLIACRVCCCSVARAWVLGKSRPDARRTVWYMTGLPHSRQTMNGWTWTDGRGTPACLCVWALMICYLEQKLSRVFRGAGLLLLLLSIVLIIEAIFCSSLRHCVPNSWNTNEYMNPMLRKLSFPLYQSTIGLIAKYAFYYVFYENIDDRLVRFM